MMNFLTHEQMMWKEQVDRLMEKEIGREYIRTCDTNREYPYKGYEAIARQDWLRLLIPEDHGGLGGTIFDYALLCEGLSRYGFDFATAFMVSTFTAMNIVKFGNDAQKAKYLEPFMRGDPARVAFQQRLVELKIEHRDLDVAITRLAQDPVHDELQLRRLKRRKLLLKDQIALLQRQFDPDVLA